MPAASTWHGVDAQLAKSLGAYCLDGSLPGFWYQPPPTPPAAGTVSHSWLIFLDGGAWCYSLDECAKRARTYLGSSRSYKDGHWPYAGPLDRDPQRNPTFARFNRVLLGYCDGASFTGDRAAPLRTRGGALLHLRGRAVVVRHHRSRRAAPRRRVVSRLRWHGRRSVPLRWHRPLRWGRLP